MVAVLAAASSGGNLVGVEEESLFQGITRLASLLQNCFSHRRSALTYAPHVHLHFPPLTNDQPLFDMAYIREHILTEDGDIDPNTKTGTNTKTDITDKTKDSDSVLRLPANRDGTLTIGDVIRQCPSVYGLRYFVAKEEQSWPWRAVWYLADAPPGSDFAGDQRDLAFRVGTMCALSSDPVLVRHADALSTLAALANNGASEEDLSVHLASLPESISDHLASEVLGYPVCKAANAPNDARTLLTLFDRSHLFVQVRHHRPSSLRNVKYAFDWASDVPLASLQSPHYQRPNRPTSTPVESVALNLLKPTGQRAPVSTAFATHFEVSLGDSFEAIYLYCSLLS